jgi:hypothetical protein
MDKVEIAFKKAREYYPELNKENIKIRFSSIDSVMQSRPKIISLFQKKRTYLIIINNNPLNTGLSYTEIDKQTLIGWFGHELAHIIDYKKMNNFQLIVFGIKYLFSNNFRRNIERKTDKLTIKKGLGKQLIKSIKAITKNPKIKINYKKKISQFYLKVKEVKKTIKLNNIKKPKFLKKIKKASA